jgi:uncharacterized protein (TIGR02246 family)
METDEQAIRNLINNWLNSSMAGDTEKVLTLMADDVVFLQSGQPPMRGKAAFAASQSAVREMDLEATADIQEIKVLGGWAYLWNKLTVVMTSKGGTPVKRTGDVLSILKKQNGAWMLFRDANLLSVSE